MTADQTPLRVTVFVRGQVQGVGFRWWTRVNALELGLSGSARNCPDGRVEVVAEGPWVVVAELLDRLGRHPGPPGRPGRVVGVSSPIVGDVRGEKGFIER